MEFAAKKMVGMSPTYGNKTHPSACPRHSKHSKINTSSAYLLILALLENIALQKRALCLSQTMRTRQDRKLPERSNVPHGCIRQGSPRSAFILLRKALRRSRSSPTRQHRCRDTPYFGGNLTRRRTPPRLSQVSRRHTYVCCP